ncbi:MAG TPA: hypothetical protein VKV39_17090 [Candidatus Sulfotelmatobacter sp.]|nr:hypothetical protein [Candidatus Sulfotelmatobacter sp.]
MSEAKNTSTFMQELDRWTNLRVVLPLSAAWGWSNDMESLESIEERRRRVDQVVENVKSAIREKVLQSFKNGRATRMPQTGERPVVQRPVAVAAPQPVGR